MRNPSGFCGMSSVSKSDFAFTVAASRLSAPIEIRSNVVRAALVQTFVINETNARDHCAAQAARTAFQTAGALLSLIRSLPSVN